MKPALLLLFTAFALFGIDSASHAQTPTTRSGRPVDPAAVENLNRINDDRVKRGLKPLDAPGYTYVPADKRTQAPPAVQPSAAPTPAVSGSSIRPLDPSLVENLNRMNDQRAKQGQPLLTMPGYSYVPADQRSPVGGAASPNAATATTGPVEASAAPETLRWVQLVNRPELWPAQCTMKQAMEFQGGVTIKAGQKVKVDGIKSREVELSTLDDKTQFVATPEETDVLEAANQEYAKLTPKQRGVTYESLMYRRELWPYRVKITQTFDLGRGERVKPGDEAILLNVERGKLFVRSEKSPTTFNVVPSATDLMAQARKFVEASSSAPSRMMAELDGKLVSSVTGKPDPLPADAQPRYIVFYRGSSTCSITRQFTPALVKYDKDTKPKHPEYEIVYIMTETPENTGKFARELGFSWRALEYETTAKMPVANASKPFSDLIPQLVVMDRTGKVLANGVQNTALAALTQLDALLNQPATP